MHVLFHHVTPITDILYVYSMVMLFYFQLGDTCALCSDKSCSLEVHHDYLAQCNLFVVVVVVVDFVLNVNQKF